MNTNRALFLVRTERWRKYYYGSSIAEFDYVINRAPPDFKLLPEILTKKCENLIRMDKGPQGVLECERAIAFKPDYWPPYAAMSDYYRNIGDLAKAQKSLEEGLLVTPDVNALKRRMAELDAAKEKHLLPRDRASRNRPSSPD
jgi:tetratricopeptide (TPR) repeat protein